MSSKRRANFKESYGRKEFYIINFQIFFSNKSIKHYPRNTSLRAVFAERFHKNFRNLPKKPVFENGDGKWVDILSTKTKHYNNLYHSSTKLTPIQGSWKKLQRFRLQ